MQGGVSEAERNARKDAAPKAAGGETPAEAGEIPQGEGSCRPRRNFWIKSGEFRENLPCNMGIR